MFKKIALFFIFFLFVFSNVFITKSLSFKNPNKVYASSINFSLQDTKSFHEKRGKMDNMLNKEKMERDKVKEGNYKPDGKKIAYLTFDDGPSPNTVKILDILKQNNIKATFFVNGGRDANLYKRIATEGHSIGNHTYSHDYATIYSNEEGFFKDVDKLNDELQKEIGFKPDIIRFPGGSNNQVSWKYGGKDLMQKLVNDANEKGYEYFDWNVSSGDATGNVVDVNTLISNVKKESTPEKIIILFHDSKPKVTSVQALQPVIDYLKEKGYSFDKLDKDSFTRHFTKVNK